MEELLPLVLGTAPNALRAAVCQSLEDDAELLLAFTDHAFVRRCLAVQALFVFKALEAARAQAYRGRRFLEGEAERKRKAEFEAALKIEEAAYAEKKAAADAAELPVPPLPPRMAQVAAEKEEIERALAEGREPPAPPPPKIPEDELEPFRIAVVGGGDTARHALDIALRSGFYAPEQFQVATRRPETLLKYAKMNVMVTDELPRALAGTQCVLLACGPRQLAPAAAALSPLLRPGLPLLSAVAGVPPSKLRATFPPPAAPRAVKLQFRHDQPRELLIPEACRAYRPPEFKLTADELAGYVNTASADLSVEVSSVYDILLTIQEYISTLCPGLTPVNARRAAYHAALGVQFDSPMFERELSDEELFFKLVSGVQETVRAPAMPLPDALLAKERTVDEDDDEAPAPPKEPSATDLAVISAFRAYFARLLMPPPPRAEPEPAPTPALAAAPTPESQGGGRRRGAGSRASGAATSTARPATAQSAGSARAAAAPRKAATPR